MLHVFVFVDDQSSPVEVGVQKGRSGERPLHSRAAHVDVKTSFLDKSKQKKVNKLLTVCLRALKASTLLTNLGNSPFISLPNAFKQLITAKLLDNYLRIWVRRDD